MVVPFASVRFICHAIVDPALYHGGDELIVKNGYLVGVIREIAGMEDVMPTLMSERKAVTMSLALIQKAVVDDDGTGLGADILRPICGRVKNRHLIGVVKNSHPKVHAIVGQILIIRRHSEIEFDKALDVHGRGVRQDFRLKILYETLSDGIDLGFAQNRYAVVLHSKRGSVHLYKLPLSLLELLDELQPVGLTCIQITCRAERSGHIVVFHDIVRQVRGNRVSLFASQIIHRSFILVVQHENLGNQLQLLHFRRVTAILLDVSQIGRSNPNHFCHLTDRDLFVSALPLQELSKILVLCVHVVHLFYLTL